MHKTHQMEEFSRAFIGAIAASAGCNTSRLSVDDDSIDLSLHMKDIESCTLTRAQIDIQLKCTKNEPIKDGHFTFILPIKNYDDLRAQTITPRLLLIVHVPDLVEEWIWQTKEFLCLHHHVHWFSLNNFPEKNNISTVTLHIPCSNIFDADFLKQAMYKTANGEPL